MELYRIGETLFPADRQAIGKTEHGYAALVSREEWERDKALFDLGIDDDSVMRDMDGTIAYVNYDALLGSFNVPRRENICGEPYRFSFALDEKGIVFIDDSGYVNRCIQAIVARKKWRAPSLERFIYDFVEEIIIADSPLLKGYDQKMDRLEQAILTGEPCDLAAEINQIRGELLDLKEHYDQLIDLCMELEENENGFFHSKELRYFRLLKERLTRFRERVNSLREYSFQIRDLYDSRNEEKQNQTMNRLTVVTSVFMPLTLITGWFGMNFVDMPLLYKKWGYPLICVLSVALVIVLVRYFKKKNWL